MSRRFKQVDVFTTTPFMGNPLAVILDAEGLSGEQMQAIARWTNLSETAFVLPPTDPAADYRVRIFTTAEEFPFAGHPTLGTAHALLEAGLRPKTAGMLVQECGVGLVPVRIGDGGSLAFRAPPATLAALDAGLMPLLLTVLGDAALVADQQPLVVDMGIRWLVVRLGGAADCMAVTFEAATLVDLARRANVDGLAVYSPHPSGGPADYEVRAVCVENGVLIEDPVTGSANACIARVLAGRDYTVRQGTALGRDGRVTVTCRDGEPWIGGKTVTIVDGVMRA
ncbi:phenazine biosynthesis-like protein [Duganella caerulea]|uniref:PhzF family phenazine biosynthesis protein n=1 Tax=Duganella caerulea TaxID=2885762 RepID=UPI0030EA4842